VIGALLSQHSLRSQTLDALLPDIVTLGGRTGVVVAGLGLLLLARGIVRGKMVAWRLTLVVLLTSIGLHLLKDLDLEEASLAAWIFIGLLWMRHHFQAQSDPVSVRRGLATVAAGCLLAAAYGLIGTLLLSDQLELESLRPLSARAAWFLGSLPAVSAALVLLGLFQLLRPVLAPAASGREREQLRQLVSRWGHNPVCHLAIYGPTSVFWTNDGTCVAYSTKGGTAIALGDPIGPAELIEPAAAGFAGFCDRHDWTPAFYQVEGKEPYRSLGFRLVPIGSDAILRTADFSLQGKERAVLRNAVHRCARLGIRFVFLSAPRAWEAHSAELLEVSGSWLETGKGPELGFSLGTLATLHDPAITVGLAFGAENRLEAFASWLPVPGRRGWTLDLMRRRPNGVRGLMESLIVSSVGEAGPRGIAELSLGLAPLMIVPGDGDDLANRRLAAVYASLERFRRSRSLRQFKAKFDPVWEERYLAVPTRAALPEVLIALLGAHLPGVSWVSLRLSARVHRAGLARRAT
jgi:phosphatidylglycerol lysyltransferase